MSIVADISLSYADEWVTQPVQQPLFLTEFTGSGASSHLVPSSLLDQTRHHGYKTDCKAKHAIEDSYNKQSMSQE